MCLWSQCGCVRGGLAVFQRVAWEGLAAEVREGGDTNPILGGQPWFRWRSQTRRMGRKAEKGFQKRHPNYVCMALVSSHHHISTLPSLVGRGGERRPFVLRPYCASSQTGCGEARSVWLPLSPPLALSCTHTSDPSLRCPTAGLSKTHRHKPFPRHFQEGLCGG